MKLYLPNTNKTNTVPTQYPKPVTAVNKTLTLTDLDSITEWVATRDKNGVNPENIAAKTT